MKQTDAMHRSKAYNKCIDAVIENYLKSGRHDLPWRKKITPYRILVSEIMLQQTQVGRVRSKFALWIDKYPTLSALRSSSLKEVLILWQGLGYQRRAKALLSIAKEVNTIPKSFDELLELRGVGIYTASAVCALAYDTFSHPVLETNIRTVLIEYFHQGEMEVHDKVLYDDLVRLEKNIKVKNLGARKWYYALMDYGAHLKALHISHNHKSLHHRAQSPYKGSARELRARVLYAITHGTEFPDDERTHTTLDQLTKEGFIYKKRIKYYLKETL